MFDSVQHSRQPNADAVIRFLCAGEAPPVVWEPEAVEATRREEFQAEPGQVVDAFPANSPRVFVCGLGPREALNLATFRRAAAGLGRRLAAAQVSNVAIEFSECKDLDGAAASLGETLGLLGWNMNEYKGSASTADRQRALNVWATDEHGDRGLERGIAVAESVNLARTLAATPPNVATPAWMAGQADRLEKFGLGTQVVRGADLEREGLTGLINVGKGSNHEPCLVRIEYRPLSTDHQKPVVLIGKTVTYDTGGLAIKPREGMRGMKGDKAGGCAVLGAMHAIATVVRPNFPVVALLVAAENSVSDRSYRNDDVFTFRNGVSVEVTNTDAEGRLVLADGLCWACEREDPRCIVDLATLTGGVVTALGSVFAGLFANDDSLAAKLAHAGDETGERLWRLPIDEEYREMLKSDVADIVNSAANRGAHPVAGAVFLSHFVAEGVPWAHLDIAGTAKTDRDKGALIAGPTGFGVRLLAQWIAGLAP